MLHSVGLLALSLLLVIGNVVLFVFGVVDDYQRDDFPAEFVFGSGTSAYQVEGAALEDGRSYSIWDTFAHSGLNDGANGDIACDGYHKYKEDIQLMADTGLEAFRFSISWSRLIPNGRGSVNEKGLQFYNEFINRLIAHGIQPHVTLHHLDLPQILEDEYGGWISRKSVKDFVAYADVCFREFSDRILHWTTINEGNLYALGGYDLGSSSPGRCYSPFGFFNCTEGDSTTEPYLAAHHMLLAHASTVRLYRQKYKVFESPSKRDYPEIVKKNAGTRIPKFTKLESEKIKGSFDFLGINHYTTLYIKDNPNSLEMDTRDVHADMALIYSGIEFPITQFPVIPLGLEKVLNYLKEEYGNPPIYIHENGQVQGHNGTLIDTIRVEYLHAFIGSVLDALRNGSNTRGYFVWSFLDLLELVGGYDYSYGLYYVGLRDKQLTRYPKLSGHWYTNFLKGNNISGIISNLKIKDSFSS